MVLFSFIAKIFFPLFQPLRHASHLTEKMSRNSRRKDD